MAKRETKLNPHLVRGTRMAMGLPVTTAHSGVTFQATAQLRPAETRLAHFYIEYVDRGQQKVALERLLNSHGYVFFDAGPVKQKTIEAIETAVNGPTTGICQFCFCTEERACMTSLGPCSWLNREQTVCSAPRCARKWRRSLQTGKRKRR